MRGFFNTGLNFGRVFLLFDGEVGRVEHDGFAGLCLPREYAISHEIFDRTLYHSSHRPGAEAWVVAALHKHLDRCRRQAH